MFGIRGDAQQPTQHAYLLLRQFAPGINMAPAADHEAALPGRQCISSKQTLNPGQFRGTFTRDNRDSGGGVPT